MGFRAFIVFLFVKIIIGVVVGQRLPSDLPRPSITQNERQFGAVYEWKVIDFAFPTENIRQNALFTGDYIPQNNIISDVKAYGSRLYFSLPRMLPGVPATLGWVVAPQNNGKTNPEIEPFPSWEMNKVGNCSALQFVQGIEIDAEGIMWVVDSGNVDTLLPNNNRIGCPPKIILLDLKQQGKIIHTYIFPEEVASQANNYLNKVVVDDAFGGFAYITDNSGLDPGIIVYSRRLNRSWKVREPNTMRASAEALSLTVNNIYLNFSIHIDGIALGPYYTAINTGQTNERNVYYCPLSSYHLYSIPASVLRDPSFVDQADPRDIFQYVTDHGLKSSQTDGMIMDNLGILYYGLLNENSIAQWDSFKPFLPENQQVIAQDRYHIQWVDGMGFDEAGHLYVVVNKFQRFIHRQLDLSQVNFRILQSKTGTLSYIHTGRGTMPSNNINGLFVPKNAVTIQSNGIEYNTSPLPLTLNPTTYSSSFFGSSTRLPFTSSASKPCLFLQNLIIFGLFLFKVTF